MLARATTFDRRQRVLRLLREQPGIRVAEIAQRLGVSEGTVRNDLNALAEDGQLARVRGGGVPTDEHPGQSEGFLARLSQRQEAKQLIARWAADLVEDGDAILLDASTTAYYLAGYLKERRNLTVVTNGIEVGRKLAQDAGHTVMLLGGVLSTDGVPVTELLSEHVLRGLHIKTAFVSCAGFTLDTGLTEHNIQEAQIKSTMIGAAGSVVALIDSLKFGRIGLAPFARVDQVARIFTDGDLAPEWIEGLQETPATLTICEAHSAADFTPRVREARHYRIGFANQSEMLPFAVDVRRGLERAAQGAGNVDLVLADNQLSREVALRAAEYLVGQDVDLVIEYQIDAGAADLIMHSFRKANIPVIAVDIPMLGATFFGVDNYRAGHMAGEALGRWVQDHWDGAFDRLLMLEEPRAGSLPAGRMRGQLDGLQNILGEVPEERILHCDSGNTAEISEQAAAGILQPLPAHQRLAVLSFNDDAAIGAITAAHRLGRAGDIVVVGQGADRRARDEMRRPGSPLIGSTAYRPEDYGRQLMTIAQRLLEGEPLPPAIYMEHAFITADNVDQFYPES